MSTLFSIPHSDYLRPDKLFEAMRYSPLADGDKLASLDVAERDGYFFSSTRPFYQAALDLVRAEMHELTFTDLEDYLAIHPSERRRARAEDQQFAARIAADGRLREAQIMLEEYAVLRSARMMMAEGAKYLEQQDILSKKDLIRAKLGAEHAEVFDDCLITPFNEHFSPIKRLDGIPSGTDITNVPSQTTTCQSPERRKLLREAIAGIADENSESWQRLNDISRYWAESIGNLSLLKQM